MPSIRAIIVAAVPAVTALFGLLWYWRKRRDTSDGASSYVFDGSVKQENDGSEVALSVSDVARENTESQTAQLFISYTSSEEPVTTSRQKPEACEEIIAQVEATSSLMEPKADLNSNSDVSVSKVLDIEHSESNVTEFRPVIQVKHDCHSTSSSSGNQYGSDDMASGDLCGSDDVVSGDHCDSDDMASGDHCGSDDMASGDHCGSDDMALDDHCGSDNQVPAAQCNGTESTSDSSPVFCEGMTGRDEKTLVSVTAHTVEAERNDTCLPEDAIDTDDQCSSSHSVRTDYQEESSVWHSVNLKVNISDCKEEKVRSWGSLSSPLEGEISQFSAHLPESAQTEVSVMETVESPTEKLMNSSVASSGSSDAHSEGSNDSGKGASLSESGVLSPSNNSDYFVYKFDWPTEMCGRLIGKQHKNINSIMQKTNTKIVVHRKAFDPEHQCCAIEGNKTDVEAALNILKSKFPRSKNPGISFQQTNVPQVEKPMVLSEAMQLSLPEGVMLDVVVSSVVDVSHIFVQQPTHPMFPLLDRLNQCMMMCYNQDGIVPQLPRPIDVGVICAAPMYSGWYRAQVVHAGAHDNSDECDIKFLDYGGYVRVQASSLRQIRSDFTTLPFQAVECYLANVVPIQGEDWAGGEAVAVLEELVQQQLLQASVVGQAEDGIVCVDMYATHKNRPILVNRELVNRGVARWQEVEG